MSKWFVAFAVSLLGFGLASPLAVADEELSESAVWVENDATGEAGPAATWSVRGGVLFLQRTGSKGVLLMSEFPRDNPLLRFGPAISAGDLQFPMAGGPDISIARQGPVWREEVRYFGQDWATGTRSFESPFGGWLNFSTPLGSSLPTRDSAQYHSRLDSIEFNLRRPLTWWLTPLVGFRYVGVDEQLDMRLDVLNPVTLDLLNRNDVAVRAHNRLLGGQVGFDALLWQGQDLPFRWETTLKAGVYGNSSGNDTRLHSSLGTPDLVSAASGGATSFVGEFGLTFVYQMTPRLNWRIGYEMLGISGLATSPRQLSVSDPLTGQATVNSTGGAFYHGANLAAEYRW